MFVCVENRHECKEVLKKERVIRQISSCQCEIYLITGMSIAGCLLYYCLSTVDLLKKAWKMEDDAFLL